MYRKSCVIDGFLYEVIDARTFFTAPPGTWDTSMIAISDTFCVINMFGSQISAEMLLLFRTEQDRMKHLPGIYNYDPANHGVGYEYITPYIFDDSGNLVLMQPEYIQYTNRNETYLDTSNITQMQDLIRADTEFKEQEFGILSASTSVFSPPHLKTDSPEMAAFKEAIRQKRIDLDRYKSKIGPTYNNDKRLLQKDSITFPKIKTIASPLGLRVYLVIDNESPDVANPIPSPIFVDIINGDAGSVMSGDYYLEGLGGTMDDPK